MSLQDAIAAALPGLRAEAEALMVDTVLVEAPTGGFTIDPDTLEQVPTYSPVYSGNGRVQRSGGVSASDHDAGGAEFGIAALYVQLPIAATGIERGHRVTVTAVDPESDPDLLGLVATVQANRTKTHATKRTLVCEEVS